MRIRVTGQNELGGLAHRLRSAADGGLQRDVNTELRKAAAPVRSATRAAVRGASFPDPEPAAGGSGKRTSGQTGLRAGLARATRTKDIGNGVRFEVEGSLVGRGSDGHRLAKLTDTELAPRWKHPTHGRTSRGDLKDSNKRNGPSRLWRRQIGQRWFFVSIRAGRGEFEAGIERGMDKTARRIEG